MPITSTFDSGADGWTGVTSLTASPSWSISSSGHAPAFSSTDGQPAGSIRLTDPNNDWTYFRAPSKFLGDLTPYAGGTLSWDSRTVVFGGGIADEAEVVLMGAGLVLVHQSTATLSSEWTSFSVALAAGPWRVAHTFTGPLATAEQVAAVFGNLQDCGSTPSTSAPSLSPSHWTTSASPRCRSQPRPQCFSRAWVSSVGSSRGAACSRPHKQFYEVACATRTRTATARTSFNAR